MTAEYASDLQVGTGHVSRAEHQRRLSKARHRKKAILDLADTLAAMPDPPCERAGVCPNVAHCAKTGDACAAFMLYSVQMDCDQAPREPHKELGKRLWNKIEVFPQSMESLLKRVANYEL